MKGKTSEQLNISEIIKCQAKEDERRYVFIIKRPKCKKTSLSLRNILSSTLEVDHISPKLSTLCKITHLLKLRRSIAQPPML